MPSPDRLVINTGPLIALVAGLDSLDLLRELYREVIVPFEVADEIAALRTSQFVQPEFAGATWLTRRTAPMKLAPWLRSVVGRGEAAVIQLALDENLSTVCIDEAAGRRVAQLSGLLVTGSLGILLRANATQSCRPCARLWARCARTACGWETSSWPPLCSTQENSGSQD